MDESQQKLLEQELTRDEGKKNVMYKDSLGKNTVGIGRLMDGKPVSDAVISLMFSEDITESEAFLNRNIPWWTNLSPIRQRVLLNMAFNLGGKLLQFKNTLFAIQAEQFDTAAKEMLDSLWAKQVGKRAKRLAYMMQYDKVPPQTAEFF